MPHGGRPPNIVIMYADDLGFGDVGCYGATAVATPNIDRLAAEGLRFSDGYASAATCTPSRYSLLTGAYPWRNPRAAILAGDAPLIIEPDAATLPGLLRRAGYRTGIVGKWHLGLGRGRIDWNSEIDGTPNDAGFDDAFIMASTNDRVPCVYVENRRVAGLDPGDPLEVSYDPARAFPDGLPTGRLHPEKLVLNPSHGHDGAIVNGVSRIGFMRGGASALWNDAEMSDLLLARAIGFVERNRAKPFFLYYSFHQPHVPRIPGARFKGISGLGARGDVIMEMDACVGALLDNIDRLGLTGNTLVIFSSDNGPVLDDGYADEAVEKCGPHRPAGPLRGGKYSLFDGGARVPFILRWSETVAPGESAALVSHIDFTASFAALAGLPLAAADAPDSLNLLSALLGRNSRGRRELVTEGTRAKTVLRRDNWVYIPPHPGAPRDKNTGEETGCLPEEQLYDLAGDIGQIRNLAAERPDKARAMAARLRKIRQSRRTRPAPQIK